MAAEETKTQETTTQANTTTEPTEQNNQQIDGQQKNIDNQQQPTEQTNQQQERTFTQKEVNEISARQKKEGSQALLNKYNLTEDQLEGIASILVPKTETKVESVQTMQQERESLVRIMKAEAKGELAIAGVRAETVDDMILLATANLDPETYTEDELKEAIKSVQSRHPSNFSTQTDLQPGSKGGTGSNLAGNKQVANGGTSYGEPGSLGRKLAKGKL